MYIFKNKKGNKRFIDNIIYEGLDKGGEEMLTFLKKNIIACISVVVTLSVVGVLVYCSLNNEVSAMEIVQEEQKCECEEISEEVLVDIKGAVKKPGVYKLSKNSIVNDVIVLAGGLKSGATTDDINLSKAIYNEMVIYISTKSELKEKQNNTSNIPSSTSETKVDNICVNPNKVNINSATVDELTTLNGIGEAKAIKIIEYRNTNGLFKSIEDIKNVSGIGEAFYEKIKDNITI